MTSFPPVPIIYLWFEQSWNRIIVRIPNNLYKLGGAVPYFQTPHAAWLTSTASMMAPQTLSEIKIFSKLSTSTRDVELIRALVTIVPMTSQWVSPSAALLSSLTSTWTVRNINALQIKLSIYLSIHLSIYLSIYPSSLIYLSNLIYLAIPS